MINLKDFRQDDLVLINGHLLVLAICSILIAATFWTGSYLNSAATNVLAQTSSQVDAVRTSIEQIQAELNTAAEYTKTYEELQTTGVVGSEDRLQLLELLAQIRSRHELFPISINIGEQAGFTLPYANSSYSTGQPVDLHSSVLDLEFPLLHEEDFARLMDDLLASSHLLQPAHCSINATSPNKTNFYYLDKHFSASCSMYWYTFNATDKAEVQP